MFFQVRVPCAIAKSQDHTRKYRLTLELEFYALQNSRVEALLLREENVSLRKWWNIASRYAFNQYKPCPQTIIQRRDSQNFSLWNFAALNSNKIPWKSGLRMLRKPQAKPRMITTLSHVFTVPDTSTSNSRCLCLPLAENKILVPG